MKVIILNSGEGKRMGDLTDYKPKCMVNLNEDTILSRQLKQLRKHDLTDIIITTGPHERKLVKYTKKNSEDIDLEFVNNEKYAETNYIYSLYLTKDLVYNEDVVLMHGDLFFEDEIVDILLKNQDKSCGLINEVVSPPEKDFKAIISDGFVKKIGVDIEKDKGVLFQPFYFLKNTDFKKWMFSIEKFVDEGKTNVYAEDALNPLLENGKINLKGAKFKDKLCMEIDTPVNLKNAKSILNR